MVTSSLLFQRLGAERVQGDSSRLGSWETPNGWHSVLSKMVVKMAAVNG